MSLQNKRLKLDIVKANAAIAELEYKIEERLEDIERTKDHISKQHKLIKLKEAELEKNKE